MRPTSGFHPVRDLAGIWATLFLMSGVINALGLSGAVYMLQVYDRVLTSHSVETLIALSSLLLGLYVVLGILDAIRSQMLIRIGSKIDAALMPKASIALAELPLRGRRPAEAIQPVRDIDQIRHYFGSPGAAAPLDLPWTPIFLLFVWALSPLLGIVTLCGLAALILLAALNHLLTWRAEWTANQNLLVRVATLDATSRNAETIAAMGLGPDASAQVIASNRRLREEQRRVGDMSALFGSASKTLRLMFQAAILGLGALLAIRGEMSAGAMIAASIAAARALAPVEQAIATWTALLAARQSFRRLNEMLAFATDEPQRLALPQPRQTLTVERLSTAPPGTNRLCLSGISFELRAGTAMAVVGKSGAGKTSLARAITGAWPAAHGTVKLDGAPLERWSRRERGQYIGYLPQQIVMFPGTIAQNIARLEPNPDPATVIEAARGAGLHEFILGLREGYGTEIDADGAPLSAGQRQQLGLARALFGQPFLVVLDEPNASLDADGEEALATAIRSLKSRGAIVIAMAHRRSLLTSVDIVAIMEGGQLRSMSSSREFLGAHLTPITERARPAATGTPATRARPQGASS